MDETNEDLVAAQMDVSIAAQLDVSNGSRVDDSPTQPNNQSKTSPTSADATRVQNNLKARKRTKTGCLTCRKRRIKCGEERPTCANCIKSKRSCEGYAPRLTFKDPLSAFHPGWSARGNGIPYPNIATHNGAAGQFTRPQLGSGSQSQFPVIAPRPMPQHSQHGIYMTSDGAASGWSGPNYVNPQAGMGVAPQPSTLPQNTGHIYQQTDNDSGVYIQARYDDGSAAGTMQIDPQAHNNYGQQSIGGVTNINTDLQNTTTTDQTSQWLQNSVAQELASKQNASSYSAPPTTEAQTTLVSPVHVSPAHATPNQPSTSHVSPIEKTQHQEHPQHSNQSFEPQQNGRPENISPILAPPPNPYPTPPFGASNPKWSPEGTENGAGVQISPVANNTANEQWQRSPQATRASGQIGDYFPAAGADNHGSIVDDLVLDDDYYDVESDEEMGMMGPDETVETIDARAPNDDITLMLALSKSKDDQAMRSYHQYLHRPDILTNYTPRFAASPLMDATTARIFCHFITVTGPGLSIYERHPVNPSIIFTGAQVPKSQRSLWTYTLPVLALSHPCLLQAMLALASLQIARLQQAPMTVPMKHYHYALVKIGKAVSTPSKRTSLATIAATLILAHFEATTAEHAKWSSHLAGARQLLMEVDFKGITRRIKEDRSRMADNTGLSGFTNSWVNNNFHPYDDMPYIPTPDGLDENLVSQIMGWRIKYDQYGTVLDDGPTEPRPPLTEKDINTYQVHRDLFWWYCKQDIIQSVISGKPLLLPYDRWVHCPPRAPIGRVDAIYGTMDHLSLLLGRIADFASRDQIRKKKVMQANGGHWMPPPGMFPRGPPADAPTGGPPPKPAPPAFYGMVPDTPTPRMPDAFTRAPRDQIYTPPSPVEDMELNSATADAEAEWREIQNALDIFEQSLGPAWQPLSPDTQPPIATPFGTAMQYRTYHMTSIWSIFYTGRIIAARTHPSMPPAAMMAAAVAAGQTAKWANMIGRIVFGLQLPPENQGLNPTMGTAMTETILAMFFAGVQYTDIHQRAYTIERLRIVAERIGEDSAALIAAGCETCWIKLFEAGRGPPYEKTVKTTEEYAIPAAKIPKHQDGKVGPNKNRSLVYVQPGVRVSWAMGVMGLEEDFQDMAIVKRE